MHRFEYCQHIKTAEEFNRYTNVRELVGAEIHQYKLSIGRGGDAIKELKYIGQHVATIFRDFVPMKDAWCWTLLKDIQMQPEFMQSNCLLYDFSRLKRAKVCVKVSYA